MILDISPTISSRLAVFPGDQSFDRIATVHIAKSTEASLEISAISCTLHLGAHADAPCHYDPCGIGIDAVALDRYIGPCQVISATCCSPRALLSLEDLKTSQVIAPRLLVRTGSFPDYEQWSDCFTGLSADLVTNLGKQGVFLIGIDTPSIDLADSKSMPAHCAAKQAGISILEGLVLQQVNDGLYDLVALPLKIKDADASPVRAVLLQHGTLRT
jgi:arylformamidase